MGNTIPKRPPVPEGKIRICVAGFGVSNNVARAKHIADAIVKAHPDKYESWFYFNTFGFKALLQSVLEELPDSEKQKQSTTDKGTTVGQHHSAPFCWLEETTGSKKTFDVKGGRDMLATWAQKDFPNEESIQALTSIEAPSFKEMFFDNNDLGTWTQNQTTP